MKRKILKIEDFVERFKPGVRVKLIHFHERGSVIKSRNTKIQVEWDVSGTRNYVESARLEIIDDYDTIVKTKQEKKESMLRAILKSAPNFFDGNYLKTIFSS